MRCEQAQEQLLDYLHHQLSPPEQLVLDAHLAHCPDCQAELASTRQLWLTLGQLPTPEPSEQLRPNFYAMLAEYKKASKPSAAATWLAQARGWLREWLTPQFAARVAYNLCLLIVGIAGGYWMARPQPVAPATASQQELAQLTRQVQDMRQVLLLSLIEAPSATERLRAVGYTKELSQANPRVVEALLSTLNHDDNVNVRLATLEALAQLAPNEPAVRQGLVRALTRQDSPLVQSALADVMVQLQEKRSVPPLRRLLRQPDLNEAVKAKIQESIKSLSSDAQTHETFFLARPAHPAELSI
ncbi:HEAT repeat domain-containing protein [Hymenobacter jeollabukensis]|uniref:HEAT repeat domain-containing protein n=1 Tax=Hymenobacter jeollabukensis TaxID=2025313 RepID=A0A5R8WLA6_9BACT|nr:HEAT repeat domain-containing protein [Hymenobacter jeollabukensis]TLM90013.1 HEAT repeat domain-containing protein [Hymenobacter jeollabukensis]